jgi:hypothetical protein
MRAGTGCCACRSMLPARPAGTARPGPRAWTGRTSPAAGMAGGRSGRSWPVGGAAGRRSEEHLAGAGRAGGDGGLCAARCGSTARAGWQGWLLTVWPGLGQHGPGARRSPAAYRRGSGTCGPGDDASPPGAAGPLILIPPEDRGPALGPFPGRPDGRPGNPRSSPAAACMAGGRAGSTSRAAGPPDGQGGGSCGHRGRPPGAGCVPGQRRPGTPSGSGRWRSDPCCRVGRMVFAARPLHILAGSRGTGPGSRRAARTRGRCAVRPVRGHCPGCVITYRAYYQRPGAPAHPRLLRSLARAGDTGSAPGPAPWSPSPSRPAN